MNIRSSTLIKRAKNVLMEIDMCAYCGRIGSGLDPDGRKWHIDHVIPLALGGPDQPDNLVKACVTCNTSKNTKLWEPLPGTITAAGTKWWPEDSSERHIQQLRLQVSLLQDQIIKLEKEIDDWAKDNRRMVSKLFEAQQLTIEFDRKIMEAIFNREDDE